MDKRYIYLIQMHSGSLPSRLVKAVTRDPYSHVGICLDSSCREIYSFGRKEVNNFLNGGFVVEQAHGAFFQKFPQTLCRIWEIPVTDHQFFGLQDSLNRMAEESERYNYDFLGAVLRIFRIPVSFPNAYVCSQFVAELLERWEILHFPKAPGFVAPKDFAFLPGAREIYRGNYLAYCTSQKSREEAVVL